MKDKESDRGAGLLPVVNEEVHFVKTVSREGQRM